MLAKQDILGHTIATNSETQPEKNMSASDNKTSTAEFDSLLPGTRMDRRGFVTTIAAAGFALAVQPVHASTVITTDGTGLELGNAMVSVGGDALPVYFARPAKGDKLPVVLVVQEIFGVHEHIRDVCRRLAKQGYLAIAPELYFRQGDPTKLENVSDILTSIVSKVTDAQVMTDLDACVELGRYAWRRCCTLGHHRLLLGRAHHLALCGTQAGPESGGRVVWPP